MPALLGRVTHTVRDGKKNDIRDVNSTANFSDFSDFAVSLCFFFDSLRCL